MGFTKEKQDDVTILKIQKERLDSTLAPDLKSEFLILVDQGSKKILVDLSNVTYADSSGLGALLFGLRQLKGSGGKLRLLSANDRIMSLVRIARLEEYLRNFSVTKDAISSFETE